MIQPMLRAACLFAIGTLAAGDDRVPGPTTVKLTAPEGEFVLSDVALTRRSIFGHDRYVFRSMAKNSTARPWTEVVFGVEVQNTDGSVFAFSVASPHSVDIDSSVLLLHDDTLNDRPFDLMKSFRVFLQQGEYIGGVPGTLYKGIVLEEDCVVDYMATRSLSGVELRKKLAELVGTRCARINPECPCDAIKTKTFERAKVQGRFSLVTFGACLQDVDKRLGWVPAEGIYNGEVPMFMLYPSPQGPTFPKVK